MVAAAKLRRAQEAILSARPYADQLKAILNRLTHRLGEDKHHPLLQSREIKREWLVVITSDRGLCGAFNTNILKAAQRHLVEKREQGVEVCVGAAGRRGVGFFSKREDLLFKHDGLAGPTLVDIANKISKDAQEAFLSEKTDSVILLYNRFKNVASQEITFEPVLPLVNKVENGEDDLDCREYLWEPTDRDVFAELLPKSVQVSILRSLLESQAAEHGARMSAMESATKNADEMIDKLTLYLNRVRQAGITKEIIEIVSGAQAIEG